MHECLMFNDDEFETIYVFACLFLFVSAVHFPWQRLEPQTT